MVDRIIEQIDKKGLSVNAVEKQLGFGNGAIKRFASSSPSVNKILALSNFLNVSVDYLLTGNTNNIFSEDEHELLTYYRKLSEQEKVKLIGSAKNSSQSALTQREQECLSSFNNLNPDDQLRYIGRMEATAEFYSEQDNSSDEQPKSTILIKHSLLKVSAGTGNPLDEESMEEIEVVDTSETRRADFCLTITGSNMEPVYYNGDIVLVKKQPQLELGQIGIFIIEGEGYIKKYGGDRLISLNATYDDILFSNFSPEDIMCSGLVIGRI